MCKDISNVPLTTRYLSIAWTKARGSILTGPPFHCFTFAQSGCLCNWHFNWCVLKNFKACDPLLREKLKIICEKKLFYYFHNIYQLKQKIMQVLNFWKHKETLTSTVNDKVRNLRYSEKDIINDYACMIWK